MCVQIIFVENWFTPFLEVCSIKNFIANRFIWMGFATDKFHGNKKVAVDANTSLVFGGALWGYNPTYELATVVSTIIQ